MSWQEDLGNQLRTARKAARLTQGELAKHLSVSRQMVSRYENAWDTPGYDVLSLAANVLGTEFHVLDLRIAPSGEPIRLPLRSLPKQLTLDFDKSRSFPNAVIRITPHKGRILITADIPA
jgi:transcriptional regulator with XRE-family HTH domain